MTYRELRREWEQLRDAWIAGGRKGPKPPGRDVWVAGRMADTSAGVKVSRPVESEAREAAKAPTEAQNPRERVDARSIHGVKEKHSRGDGSAERSAFMNREREDDARVIAIVSDIHFDLHDEPTWYAFREWHAFVRPKHTVILGDFVDLGMLSRYEQGPEEPVFAIPQIRMFVREATALLRECDVLTICMGNHDDRWAKTIGALKPAALRGALGLSLQEQCEAQGLERSPRVRWFTEGRDGPALMVAGYALHHGHTKSGKWGGPKHLAASLLDKGNGQSQIVGHSHRAQLFMRGAFGRQSIAIANPAMCRPMTYANDPDWQRGWTALSMLAPDYRDVVPHVLIAHQGRVAWGGRTFGVRTREVAA